MSGSQNQASSTPTNSFSQRRIDLTIQIGQGSFGESGFDTVTLSGLRVVANISSYGIGAIGEAHLRIYGMPLSLMNQLSTLGMLVTQARRNNVQISASTDDGGMAIVYKGSIIEAWADFTAAPDVSFQIHGGSGSFEAIKPVSPTSYRGTVDAALVIQTMAAQMGYSFENNGVSVQFSNPYFPGTGWWQMQACAKAANIHCELENGIVAIWPKGGSRGGLVPLISPQTGMVGYPTFCANGLVVTSLYNPSIRLGCKIKVQSSLTPACGTWVVTTLIHDLASELPGGPWFSRMEVAPIDFLPR